MNDEITIPNLNKQQLLYAIIGITIGLILSLGLICYKAIDGYNQMVEKYNDDCPLRNLYGNSSVKDGLFDANIALEIGVNDET